MKTKLSTYEIETALANHFNCFTNIVVPNVKWGMNIHECDLLVLTKRDFLIEVEIKRLKSDLLHDLKKEHKHQDNRIRKFYFAITKNLLPHINVIPERAGILIVRKNESNGYISVSKIRESKVLSKYKCTNEERIKLARLGACRIWSLKKKIIKLRKEKEKWQRAMKN